MQPSEPVRHRPSTRGSRLVEHWLRFVVGYPKSVVLCVFAVVAVATFFATHLHKDTSANAYIEPGNPALLYREKAIESFGLKEPIVVVVRNVGAGILDESSLRFVRLVAERLERIPNIDVDRIASLASRSSIRGGSEGLQIERLLPDGQIDQATVTKLHDALDATPLYDGTLVSKDRTATLIAAELLDERLAADTYASVMEMTKSLPDHPGIEIFVAGAGAITGYFSSYIDRDAGRLVPFTAITVCLVLFGAFLTIRSSALPMLIAVATILVTLGAMAASGVAFYAITNGMVVVLIGISVAEPMHVFGEYYALMRARPADSNAELVVGAMRNVWRPIALTSVTTVGGFFSLWMTSTMPPIRYFGLFGAFGVAVAWVLTVSFLPASMAILAKRPSRLMARVDGNDTDPIGRLMVKLGALVIRWPRTVLIVASVLCGLALMAASLVRVDHARIENFNPTEPLYIADREINLTMAGTNQLDVVVEAEAADGILTPDALHRIDAVQAFALTLPEVGGVTSIVDYIKQLNRAVDDDASASWRIPNDPRLIAQLMLTYQASAAPTEFQSLVDSTGRTALVRIYLRADRWSEQRKVVQAMQGFIDRTFADGAVKATLTGRVMLDYEWVRSVASGHVLSVVVSTLAVLLMCMAIFRSVRDGLLCLAPLFVSVVFVYAAMGLGDIWLGVATSMFASVAIGLGIDFAIHMVSRARKAQLYTTDTDAAVMYVYLSTGRAVLFNAIAVGLGFGIVTLSQAPPIRMFGVLVATAIVGAFIAALTVLPAILKLMGDAVARGRHASASPAVRSVAPFLATIAVGGLVHSPAAHAEETQEREAERVMDALARRPEGTSVDRTAHIKLIDRHGSVREQTARAVRKNVADGRRMAVFYEAPASIRGTAFLVFDYIGERADDQWLYLPALRKVRRVPAADRGDYFLGTDLTYDEIRNDNRVTLSDWRFRSVGTETLDHVSCPVIEGVAADDQVAKELGYGRARWWVDTNAQIARRIQYWDRAGNLLKTVENGAVTNVDGIWSALSIDVLNHKTGHRTKIEFRDARYDTALPDDLFTQQRMERGL